MYDLKKRFGVLGLLLSVYFLVLMSSYFVPEKSSMHVLTEIMTGCQYSAGGGYHPGPYDRSISWCTHPVNEPAMLALMNHVELGAQRYGLDATFAPEFGSYVRLMYFPGLDTHMINPMYTHKSDAVIMCRDSFGDENTAIDLPRHLQVTLMYLNRHFKEEEVTLTGKESCLAQAMMELF